MRFIGIIALLLVLFAGGMMTGMMYEPKQHDETTQGFPKSKEDEVEIGLAEEEIAKENNPNDTLEVEQLNTNKEENHFIHKLATSFEKITTTFFEKIINLLYAIAESLF